MKKDGKSTTERGYGWKYQKARKALLADNPRCHWCGAPATTADHEPPMEIAGPHDHLLPACGPCNFGRRHRARLEAQKRQPPKEPRYLGPSRDW